MEEKQTALQQYMIGPNWYWQSHFWSWLSSSSSGNFHFHKYFIWITFTFLYSHLCWFYNTALQCQCFLLSQTQVLDFRQRVFKSPTMQKQSFSSGLFATNVSGHWTTPNARWSFLEVSKCLANSFSCHGITFIYMGIGELLL